MNLQQVIDYWINPALEYFPENLRTPNRVQFMLAIGLIESGYNYVAQEPEPIALGYWQVELNTWKDNILNFLEIKNEFNNGWTTLKKQRPATYGSMASDCLFACYMAAIKVYRAPQELPELGDLTGMAEYWKKYYNASPHGASVDEAIARMQPIVKQKLSY